jgi:hypothetical protein
MQDAWAIGPDRIEKNLACEAGRNKLSDSDTDAGALAQ